MFPSDLKSLKALSYSKRLGYQALFPDKIGLGNIIPDTGSQ